MKLFNKLILFIIVSIVLLCSSNIQWSKNNWKSIIGADGKGYYAYLPATFIYHDLNFSFFDSIEKKYPNPNTYYDYRINQNGKVADKYFSGTALAMMPFFFMAHSISKAFGLDADGYSKIYFIFINLSGIFYLFIGLFYLKKIFIQYKASDGLISFLLIAITFGTNLFYYSVKEPSMSHVYSFAFITLFIYSLHNYFILPGKRTVFVLAVLLGIIVLIRPVNGIVILIAPFIAGDKNKFSVGLQFLKQQLITTVGASFLFLAIISIQLVIYKIQTGSFWIDSYGSEKFNWLDPHPIDFLISYKKGFFLYTPLAMIALLGLVQLFKKSKFQFYSLLTFLTILLYVLSSWWNWWYGGSFSSRVCVEYYAILGLLLYYTYDFLRAKWSKIIFSSAIILLIAVCQIQTYQYRYYFIHWEKMDKEHYWNVFLRIDLLNKQNPNADLLNEL
ncbi:MAG: hypothetical protein A3F72_06520 [Bacteroidetes bacterium RIFCSPLOWO2_12_FULL_35_15]|nr:MAG: hypothetical protein A3F72_06520 [Bacteroidetes bacterium RIFCSPLOWO2_12_FULL_35_15]